LPGSIKPATSRAKREGERLTRVATSLTAGVGARRTVAALTIVGLVVIALAFVMTRRHGEWEGVYVDAAAKLIRGDDIYAPGSAFAYPPFPAVLAIPFTPMGVPWQRLLWYLANIVCLVFIFRWSWIVGGGRSAPANASGITAAILAALCGFYALNTLAHQQTDIVITFLLCAGALALTTRHDTLAGGMLGAAAAFKATPLLWAVYLVLCRRFRAAAVLIGVFALLSLLPDLFWPSPDGKLWIQRWLEQFVLPSQSLAADVGGWWSDIIFNQSLGGLLQRLVNLDMPLPGAPPGRRDLVPSMVLKPIVLLLLLVIAGMSFVAARRSRRCLAARPPEAEGLEYGMVIAMMLLASPMSSPAHFVALVLPAFALAGNAARTGSLWSWRLLGFAAVIGTFVHKDLLGDLYRVLLWHGSLTWMTLALWLGAVIALFRASSPVPLPAR
jgi:hypothetical protein